MLSLKDIYWAEKHLTKVLPKVEKACTTSRLQKAFDNHLKQTEGHISRIEEIFSLLGEKARAKKCEAMDGLTKEAEEIIKETKKGSFTRDAALIIAAQKVEHYEIATYGGLSQLARTLGESEVANLLEKTLTEEKDTDKELTMIAEEYINEDAFMEHV